MTPVDIDKLKEQIGRIADPEKWLAFDRYMARHAEVQRGERVSPAELDLPPWEVRARGAVVTSLAKADAILALASPALIAKAERVDALERALTEAASTFDQFTVALREHDPAAMAQEIAVAELAASEARNAL